ncbi:hypothetical protein [Nocardia sp. NPDC004750]
MTDTHNHVRGSGAEVGLAVATAETRRPAEAVRAGRNGLQVAAELGRSELAVRARCHMLLPPHVQGERNAKRLALELLGIELHNNPGYDWEQRLRAHAQAEDKLYWSEAMDDALLEPSRVGDQLRLRSSAQTAPTPAHQDGHPISRNTGVRLPHPPHLVSR